MNMEAASGSSDREFLLREKARLEALPMWTKVDQIGWSEVTEDLAALGSPEETVHKIAVSTDETRVVLSGFKAVLQAKSNWTVTDRLGWSELMEDLEALDTDLNPETKS